MLDLVGGLEHFIFSHILLMYFHAFCVLTACFSRFSPGCGTTVRFNASFVVWHLRGRDVHENIKLKGGMSQSQLVTHAQSLPKMFMIILYVCL